jgi:hypothetical protein
LTVTVPLVDSAIEHGLVPMLDDAAENSRVTGETDAFRRLAASAMKSRAHADETASALAVFVETCSHLGIEPAIFKGRSVAERWYDAPHQRPSYDIDVFVDSAHPEHIGQLAAAFDGSPAELVAIAHMQTEGRVFEHSAAIEGVALDIHSEPFNLLLAPEQQAEFWRDTELLALSGEATIRVPSLEMSLLLALIHLMRDNFADLLHIADVGLMIDADPDWTFIARFAEAEGWTDIVRFSLGFACDTLERPSPLPRRLTPRGRALIATFWPKRYLLKGTKSVVRSHRRGTLVSILIRGRDREIGTALLQRVIPPRTYIDYRYRACRCPYPVALARWRISQHRQYRHRSSRALNLRRELAGGVRSRSGHS